MRKANLSRRRHWMEMPLIRNWDWHASLWKNRFGFSDEQRYQTDIMRTNSDIVIAPRLKHSIIRIESERVRQGDTERESGQWGKGSRLNWKASVTSLRCCARLPKLMGVDAVRNPSDHHDRVFSKINHPSGPSNSVRAGFLFLGGKIESEGEAIDDWGRRSRRREISDDFHRSSLDVSRDGSTNADLSVSASLLLFFRPQPQCQHAQTAKTTSL